MKKLKHILLWAAMLLPAMANAQVINGDLNHNNRLDVADVTLLLNGYLTGTTEEIASSADPFMADNARIVGTWWKSETESITFRADGTTDYMADCTYKFKPYQGYILFYNASGIPVYSLRVPEVTAGYMAVLPVGSDVPTVYLAAQPVVITLSSTTLNMESGESNRLTATLVPSSAGTVTWTSSDESVATVLNGLVTAVAEGTTIITASVGDASATCTVTVKVSNSTSGVNNGHEWVDLGLSVKWATMNVGASSPEGYGDYFTWGDKKTQSVFNWDTYKWYSTYFLSKGIDKYYDEDNKTVLDLSDDAANANWGGSWRMPTDSEMTELITKCTWTYTTQNGVKGYKVVGANGKSIFIPGAGWYVTRSLHGENYGSYWTNSLDESDSNNAWSLYFSPSNVERENVPRYIGRSVRPVCQ